MEAIKAETNEEDEVMIPSQPIDIPTPTPPPSDMQLMLKHMADMEERLKPKPKVKRKASEKQIACLERARASRAETTKERNKLKKELKEKNKIVEKKFVSEGLKKLKSNDISDDENSVNVSDYNKPDDEPIHVKQRPISPPPTPQAHHKRFNFK